MAFDVTLTLDGLDEPLEIHSVSFSSNMGTDGSGRPVGPLSCGQFSVTFEHHTQDETMDKACVALWNKVAKANQYFATGTITYKLKDAEEGDFKTIALEHVAAVNYSESWGLGGNINISVSFTCGKMTNFSNGDGLEHEAYTFKA